MKLAQKRLKLKEYAMSSILTNNSAMVALQTLKSVNMNLAKTTDMISTGKAIASAKDGSAIFAISKVMESDARGFKAISDSLALGESTVAVASAAAEQTVSVLQDIKALIVSANSENVDHAKIQNEIAEKSAQVASIISAAQFNGANLLATDVDGNGATQLTVLSSLDRVGSAAPTASTIAVNGVDFEADIDLATDLTAITDAATAATALGEIEAFLQTAIDAAAPWVNFGNVNNKGIDINLNYKNELDSSLEYSFAINYSQYKNEVTSLISDFLVPNSGLRGGDVTRTEVGGPISAFYGREVTGFDDQGRFTFREIADDDTNRTVIGNPHPDFTYGINLNVGYKGFDIAAFLQGSQGNDIYNYTKIFTDFPTFVNGNRSVRVLDSWTPTNTDATLPALTNSLVPAETEPNSYFVEDGSYLRLKNLQIGYELPENIVEKIGLDSFRVYVQGTNLLTFTGYDGLDPEIVSFNNLNLGVDAGAVPVANVYTLGFNIKL